MGVFLIALAMSLLCPVIGALIFHMQYKHEREEREIQEKERYKRQWGV